MLSSILLLLLKGLLAGVIVGFVTGSIRSWVDRFFLVIMLVSMMHIPIQDAIVINLIIVALAALMMAIRQTQIITAVRSDWAPVIIPAVLGGMTGRVLALNLSTSILLTILGVYAILVGIRLVLVKPMPEREDKAHPAWIAPIAGLGGLLAGLISAGGKPFTVPFYNAALGHHPRQAYALGSLGVVSGAVTALTTQVAVGEAIPQKSLLLAVYLFIVIVLTALIVNRFWTEKLNRIVNLAIAPLLVLVGIRFLMMVLA